MRPTSCLPSENRLAPLNPGYRPGQRGLSMLELLVFIVVVGLALGSLASLLAQTLRPSADPQMQRQALAIAESLLDEVTQLPFSWCDPDDPLVASVTSAAECTTLPEALGPEAGESRFGALRFDNVNDFDGYTMNGIVDAAGVAVDALAAYSASVQVTPVSLGGIASGEVLRITVTVTGSGGLRVSLDAYRSRHAPTTAS